VELKNSELARYMLTKKRDERVFFCTHDNHYKVWMILVKGNQVITKWGRIELNKKLQVKVKDFHDHYYASYYADDKIKEKLHTKNYEELEI